MSQTQLAFMQLMEELLTGLSQSFPYCEKVQTTYNDFLTTLKPYPMLYNMVIRKWHSELKPHYQDIKDKNVDKLLKTDLSIFKRLDIKTKWENPSFDASSRELLFTYLVHLNGLAEIHCAIPEKMMNTLDTMARKTVDMFQDQADPQHLCELTHKLLSNDESARAELMASMPDMNQLQNLVQTLLTQINPEDMQQLMSNTPLINATVSTLLQNIPGNNHGGTGEKKSSDA